MANQVFEILLARNFLKAWIFLSLSNRVMSMKDFNTLNLSPLVYFLYVISSCLKYPSNHLKKIFFLVRHWTDSATFFSLLIRLPAKFLKSPKVLDKCFFIRVCWMAWDNFMRARSFTCLPCCLPIHWSSCLDSETTWWSFNCSATGSKTCFISYY